MNKNRCVRIVCLWAGLMTLGFAGMLPVHLFGQNKSIILGRPTDTSITASVMFDQPVQYYLEYGTQPGTYTATTPVFNALVNTPEEIDLRNLSGNTRYYYRLRYKTSGASGYTSSPEYSFHTQRAKGSTFTFTIEADEHLYDKKGVDNMYRVTLANQAADKPDFMLSLGDIFGDDHYPFTITSGELDTLHRNYRPFLGELCHSVPFYVALGNHEGEMDYYLLNNAPNNLAVWGTKWRKFYYPNPYPNTFYSGNTDNEPWGVGQPENYYAWTWGDALFVVLDPYRDQCDTSAKPKNWDWTLGLPQYTWLKNTLEGSTAKYKFVFAHHIRAQGRGGITNAKLFEWGGYEQNGTSYTFPTKRPGWAKPIHQLFVDNGVNIFFQGHDHLFAHEKLDSVTYQEVPMAADSTYEIGILANADAYVSDTVRGTGHIRVIVSPTCVKVDFVRAYLPADTIAGIRQNGEVAFSYTVACNPLPIRLLSFNGARVGDKNMLTWVTGAEAAGDYFLVQRSTNGRDFSTIATVNGRGESATKTSYRFDDQSTPSGNSYYRLGLQNVSGALTYSDVVSLGSGSTETPVRIFPNPATDRVVVQVPNRRIYRVNVISTAGTVLNTATDGVLEVGGLANGVYLLDIQTDKERLYRKIIIQH